MSQITIKRVSYGKDDTPEEDREYKLIQGSPVGTVNDWTDFAKKNDFERIKIIEKDGSETMKEVA